MTFLHTLQIIPLSNDTTFSLCQHFQCTCPALFAFHCCHKCTQWKYSLQWFYCTSFCTLTRYTCSVFGKSSSSETFYTLQTFNKYNFFLCPNFHCTFGIQWMLQLQWMYCLQCLTVLPLHFHCIFTVCICSVLLGKSSSSQRILFHNTLFQLFSTRLTIFFSNFQ